MSLFAHASLSRVVCEAAVRFAWIVDSEVGSEERIIRGAVALLVSADERLRGVMRIPTGHFDPRLRQMMIDNCTAERESARALITGAGVILVRSGDGKRVTRLELKAPKVRVPVQLDVTELMAKLLPDSPSWYNISSSIAHSHFWGLRDAVFSTGGEALEMTPDLMDVAAAAQCAISASGLIIYRCAEYYGHGSRPHVEQSKARRAVLEPYMQHLALSRHRPQGGTSSASRDGQPSP
jgi:hypothetical protein